jgi:uncharacterized damage-inducible protein DinB
MSLTIEEFIEGVRGSRRHFLKHLEGMTPEQIVWKPYPECKNVIETLQHLVIDDTTALESLQTGDHPHYDAVTVEESDYEKLLTLAGESHAKLIAYIQQRYESGPLDAEATAWGTKMPAARAIAYLSSEDFFHAGQVSFIRMATDPTWDYYENIYS